MRRIDAAQVPTSQQQVRHTTTRRELATLTERQPVCRRGDPAMRRNRLRHADLTLPVKRIFERAFVGDVEDVARPCPTRLEVQARLHLPRHLSSHRVVLVARAVRRVADIRQIRKWTRLVHVRTRIRQRGIVVIPVNSLARIRAEVAQSETRVPLLTLDRKVVLHAIRHLKVGADSARNADGGRTGCSSVGINARQRQHGAVQWVRVRLLGQSEGTAAVDEAERHYIVVNAVARAEDRALIPRAIGEADPRPEVVAVTLNQRLVRISGRGGADERQIALRIEVAHLAE